MMTGNFFFSFHICNGPGNLQNPVIGPGTECNPFKSSCQQSGTAVCHRAESVDLAAAKLTIEFENNSPETVAELICWALSLKCSREGDKLILSE